ncbi:MAG: ABC transporter permease subunit [Lachnospiraceae bacterium]|nr:ABC transporter permease subunit [Lachnospiraceae bacterium]
MRKMKKSLQRYWPLYVMLLPGSIYLLINNYIPMAGIVVAFKQYNVRDGIYKSPNIGLKNFEFLFRTSDAWLITRNTIFYNLVFIVLDAVLAIAVAIILNEITNKKAKQAYQTLILIPFLISMVVVSYLVFAFLSNGTGFINNTILPALGKEPIDWYNQAKYWPWLLILVHIWKTLGYNCILYYATICGIDHSLYEAAAVDGANRWRQIINVTLPSIRSTVIILTLMNLGNIFRSDFGLFYQVPMNSGSLLEATNTIDTYVYRGLMQTNNIGMSSAAGVYQSVVGFILVITANLIVRKIDRDSSLF